MYDTFTWRPPNFGNLGGLGKRVLKYKFASFLVFFFFFFFFLVFVFTHLPAQSTTGVKIKRITLLEDEIHVFFRPFH